MIVRRLICDYNDRSHMIGTMSDMMTPVSCECNHVQLSIQDEDNCGDNSSDDGSNVLALVMRYLSDSDSSTDYRCLARQHRWYEGSSDFSNTSELYLDDSLKMTVRTLTLLWQNMNLYNELQFYDHQWVLFMWEDGHTRVTNSHAMKCLVSHQVPRTATHPRVQILAYKASMDCPPTLSGFGTVKHFVNNCDNLQSTSAETWTPIVQNPPRTQVLLDDPDEDIMACYDWARRSNELWHLNRQIATHRCMYDHDEVPHTAASHNVSPRLTMDLQFTTLNQHPQDSHVAQPRKFCLCVMHPTLPPRHSSDSDSSTDHQLPVSRWDWQEEESSVSSSFMDASSEDKTSATECASSSSLGSGLRRNAIDEPVDLVFFMS